jgi:uncharacterized protein YndB with AHSA1/START domain
MNAQPLVNDVQQTLVEREIVIDAPVATVWHALTDGVELARWFPLEARVTPGPGGSVWMRWRDGTGSDERIEAWDPERHLRLAGRSGAWAEIGTDYYLEGRGGGTVLRVISSGFGSGDDWSEIVSAFGKGWDFELRGLRHYLEQHRGRDRLVAWARAEYTCTHEEAWARVTGPGGWFGAAGVARVPDGGRLQTTTPSAHELSGVVLLGQPPRQLVARLQNWNDALLRVQLYGNVLSLWLSTYGVPQAEVVQVERAWQESLARLLSR